MTSSILGGGTKKPRGGPTMSGMRSMQARPGNVGAWYHLLLQGV
jgi:hypothetical protein